MERTREVYLAYRTVLDSFNDLASEDSLAVISGERQLTYRELITQAKRIALALQAEGVKQGDRVILSMSYSVDFVCGFMAILYARAVYVAIDRQWPKDRLDYIEKDSGAVMVLTDEVYERLSCIEAPGKLSHGEESDAVAIYYTSGSTGNPKGAMIHQLMLLSVCLPIAENVCYFETYELCGRIFSMGNFAYEAIIGDFLFTLFCGKTLVLATDQERLEPELLGMCMEKHRVDGTMGTPSMLIRYLDDPVFSAAFSRLKRVFLIGEAVSVRDADYIAERTDGTLYDAFGCSEVGFFAYCKVRKGQAVDLEYTTYGGKLLVLDVDGNAVQAGEAGELCVGGTLAQYALYFGQPELTAQKYRTLPDLGRIYRTGDQAVMRSDGSIRMSGRLDGMQKLHGQRLEPREIEMAMESYPGIRQAAVAVRGTGADAVLCAWYTVRDTVEGDELRKYLSDRLPGYMVPSRMLQMDELPLNTSGKLNRKALPDIVEQRMAYAAPLTDRERLICKVFETVLRPSRPLSRTDNFYLLGGDSILGMQAVACLRKALGLQYTVADLLRYPTPASLASLESADAYTENESTAECSIVVPKELTSLSEDPDVEIVLPVSTHIGSYLFMKRFGVTAANNEQRFLVLLDHAWSEKIFKHKIQTLIQRHPALRSSFASDRKGRHWQVFHKHGKAALWYKNLEHLSPEAAERFVNGFWQVIAQSGEIWKAAYFVLRGGQSVLLFSAAHTITDGMSIFVIINDLCRDTVDFTEADGLIRHRIRLIQSAESLPTWIREYYFGPDHAWTSRSQVNYTSGDWVAQTLKFTSDETEALIRKAIDLGVTPYTYVQYCYGMALLEQCRTSGLWLMTSESGRYADWEDDLDIVGDLTTLIPVWVSSEMTLKTFDGILTKLRAFPGLSELDFSSAGVWKSFEEGIISNDFIELDAMVVEAELVDSKKRSGNSMTMRNGQLEIELRHQDNEAERKRCEERKEKLERWLRKESII